MKRSVVAILVAGLTLGASAPTTLRVTPETGMFFDAMPSYAYQISASRGSVTYRISGVPSWITVSSTTGKTPAVVTFARKEGGLPPDQYGAVIHITSNLSSGLGDTARTATMLMPPAERTRALR